MEQLHTTRAVLLAITIAGAALTASPAARAQGTTKPAPKPAKVDPKKAAEDKKAADPTADAKATEDKKAADEKAAAAAPPTFTEPPAEAWDNKDVEELASKRYLFIGAHYRGTIIPKFMLNLFVDGGETVYSNSFGIDFDIRKDGFSIIPSLTFAEYGTGDIVFKEKNTKDIAGNYSLVNSSLKAVYANLDLLWSAKLSKNIDFEYGAGIGLGVVFGSLKNNWVSRDPQGNFTACAAVGAPGTGCNKADHQNSSTDKVGGYVEKSWFDGGSRPAIFPWISVPEVGLRFKPIKQFEGRLGLGFSMTGFWFGLSGAYGLEHKPKP